MAQSDKDTVRDSMLEEELDESRFAAFAPRSRASTIRIGRNRK
jgi:hypothetical protein